MSWHMYAHSHPNRGSKRMYSVWENGQILLKNVLLKLNFLDGSHLYGNCVFYILTIYHRCLFFSVLRLWHTHTHLHPNKGSKRTYLQLKTGSYFAIKLLMKINFELEGHLYANCLFCIFSFFIKCFFF